VLITFHSVSTFYDLTSLYKHSEQRGKPTTGKSDASLFCTGEYLNERFYKIYAVMLPSTVAISWPS